MFLDHKQVFCMHVLRIPLRISDTFENFVNWFMMEYVPKLHWFIGYFSSVCLCLIMMKCLCEANVKLISKTGSNDPYEKIIILDTSNALSGPYQAMFYYNLVKYFGLKRHDNGLV